MAFDWSKIATAVIPAVGDAFSQYMTNEHNSQEAQISRDWQSQQRDLQNQWQEKMWNMSNQYNSPAAQMARFKEAGLNPNLIYGEMSNSSANPMASASSGASPTSQATNPMYGTSVMQGLSYGLESDMNAQTVEQTRLANKQANQEMVNTFIKENEGPLESFTEQEIKDVYESGEKASNTAMYQVESRMTEKTRKFYESYKKEYKGTDFKTSNDTSSSSSKSSSETSSNNFNASVNAKANIGIVKGSASAGYGHGSSDTDTHGRNASQAYHTGLLESSAIDAYSKGQKDIGNELMKLVSVYNEYYNDNYSKSVSELGSKSHNIELYNSMLQKPISNDIFEAAIHAGYIYYKDGQWHMADNSFDHGYLSPIGYSTVQRIVTFGNKKHSKGYRRVR